jgi:hypothetical protein
MSVWGTDEGEERKHMTARVAATKKNLTAGKDEHRAQLRVLSRALRDVHRSLVVFSRDRYELDNGRVRGKGQLLELLLRDEAFAWLRPLSGLIVAIDELSTRRSAPSEDETAAIRAQVEVFISPANGPDAFGARYTALLASEPGVAMNHGVLRAALRDLPESNRLDKRSDHAAAG